MRSVRWLHGYASYVALSCLLGTLSPAATMGPILDSMPCTPTPLVRTIPVGMSPETVTIDGARGRAYIANLNSNSISILDTTTGALVRTAKVGGAPSAIGIVGRTGHVFVSDDASEVSVLDARADGILHTARVGRNPLDLAVDNRTGTVFVADTDSGQVSLLDAHDGSVRATVQVGGAPAKVAVDEQAGRVFVANHAQRAVDILDAMTGTMLGRAPVGIEPNTIAVDERRDHVFVLNLGAIGPPTSSTVHGSVSMLNARTGVVLHTTNTGYDPMSMAVDAATGRVFVVNGPNALRTIGRIADFGQVRVLDAATDALVTTVSVPLNPQFAAVDGRTGNVVVVSFGKVSDNQNIPPPPGQLSLLDGVTGVIQRTIPIKPLPIYVAVDARTRHAFVVHTDANYLMPNGSVSMLDETCL